MSKILILKDDRPNDDSIAYWMTYELNLIGLDQYEVREYSDLIFNVNSKETRAWFASDGVDLASYDLVYMRVPSKYHVEQNSCAIYLNSKNKKFINYETLNLTRRNKLSQYIKLNLLGYGVPKSLFANSEIIQQEYKKQGFTFPFILKSSTGYGGGFNFLVQDEQELKKILHENKDQKYIVQEYIPNDGDYRVVILEGEIICAYKRQRLNDDTHLNNVSQGARRTLVELSPDLADLAIKTAKAVNYNLSGIDIIVDKDTGKSYILEANIDFGINYLNDGVESVFYDAISKKLHNLAK